MSLILYGQYPRSEQLVQATRDFDRGRIDESALLSSYKADRLALIDMQDKCEYMSSGLFHWEDLMRPFTGLIEGSTAGALTRFLETNTFWRILKCSKALKLRDTVVDQWIDGYFHSDPSRKCVFTLPFLFLFRDFSSGLNLEQIQSLFFELIAAIETRYKGVIVFFEPSIGWRELEDEERKAALLFSEKLKKRVSNPIALMTSFFSVEREINYLFELSFDMLGFDFYRNRQQALLQEFPEDKSLLAGVISTDSTALDSKEGLHQFIENAKNHLDEDRLYFTTSGMAELLPREVMDQKIAFFQSECIQ